jgi:CRP-like cAMP-binding protein
MPEEQFQAISRLLVPVDMPQGMLLSRPNEAVEFVYFPVAGMVSVDALTDSGEQVEVCVIGREGLAGVCGVMGYPQLGHSVVVQGAGSGLRIRTGAVRAEFLKGGAFAQLVNDFTYLQMTQMAQGVLCNRLHPVEARMSRWLLTACDRIQSSSLILTQEFLAQMLGSRRSTVTEAAGQLQREGLIEYSRGKVRIVDHTALEARSCECYCIVRDVYRRVNGRNF